MQPQSFSVVVDEMASVLVTDGQRQLQDGQHCLLPVTAVALPDGRVVLRPDAWLASPKGFTVRLTRPA